MSEDDKIVLPGSENYWESYDVAQALEAKFPNQDAYNLCSAVQHNESWPNTTEPAQLVMLEEGANDEAQWVWYVVWGTGYNATRYIGRGGCDYTGWDCQSSFGWTEV